MRSIIAIIVLNASLGLAPQTRAVELPDLDRQIEAAMAANRIAGLGAGIIKNGRLVWTGAYGHADLEGGVEVTEATIFNQGSIAKLVTAVAALQLVERGLVELDADVSRYLPFELRHPGFPAAPITLRHILTHGSGIRDDLDALLANYQVGDPTESLESFLTRYLSPAGDLFDPVRNFDSAPPGSGHGYSNFGFSVAALVVERVSGTSFRDFTRDNIFSPLGMGDSGWFLADIDSTRLARPYEYGDGQFEALPYYGYATYPAGLLRTTVSDLSRFLSAAANFGKGERARILQRATMEQALTVQSTGDVYQGLGFVCLLPPQCEVWGHDGGDPGVETIAAFDRRSHDGVLVMANSNTLNDDVADNDRATIDVLLMLLESAAAIEPPVSRVSQSMWWDRARPGHGFGISQFGDTLFVAVYGYDPVTGGPVWHAAQDQMNGQRVEAILREYIGGVDQSAEAGSITIVFDSGQSDQCAGDARGDADELAVVEMTVGEVVSQWCIEPFKGAPQTMP